MALNSSFKIVKLSAVTLGGGVLKKRLTCRAKSTAQRTSECDICSKESISVYGLVSGGGKNKSFHH